MRFGRRIVVALALAFAFGLAAGFFKGDSAGLRGAIGNLSAPWLLVGFLPAISCQSALRGALVGLASTMVALTGFYVALTLVLAGHLGGGGFSRELVVEVSANRIYFLAGIVTGPLFGALGAWIGRRHRAMVPIAAGGLLAGEILAVALAQGRQFELASLYFSWGVDAWPPYIAECLLGIAVILIARAWPRNRGPEVASRP